MTAELRTIDVLHLGRPGVVACFQYGGVLVDPGPGSSVTTLFTELGDEVPDAIFLTHIHLDHAGATGALVRRWPHLRVVVHERGARHLVHPSRLIESATRIYGDDMERLWGEIVPVPQENLTIIGDAAVIEDLGGRWRIAHTPGHASHHLAYFHESSGTVFAGDVAGVRLGSGPVLPPTPPPDIDLAAWAASIALLRSWGAARLAVTHFGVFDDVDAQLTELEDTLRVLGAAARRTDNEGYAALIRGIVRRSADPALAAATLQAMPPETLWSGLDRYWRRRDSV